ncbi:MAG: hypothetical protein JWL83_1664 [Actinomycetia bacterium]|jgi:hypothetical protein|nr:hypothetical protein [Actinomycetes bacterium]
MIRKRATRKSAPPKSSPVGASPPIAPGNVAEWVRSLPWVVERPADSRSPGVRLFAVDCPPLRRRRVWLVTGLGQQMDAGATESADVAAVMPVEASRVAEDAGWDVLRATPLPADHVLMTLGRDTARMRESIEAFVLAAYNYAMS